MERLRAELAAASKEMEESARLMERFQGLHLSDGGKAITSGVKRKLKELETLKGTQKENERLLSEREEQVRCYFYAMRVFISCECDSRWPSLSGRFIATNQERTD